MEKLTTQCSYWLSGILTVIGTFFTGVGLWLGSIDWNRIAVVTGVILAVATYFTNAYYQRRQLRAEITRKILATIEYPLYRSTEKVGEL